MQLRIMTNTKKCEVLCYSYLISILLFHVDVVVVGVDDVVNVVNVDVVMAAVVSSSMHDFLSSIVVAVVVLVSVLIQLLSQSQSL